MSKKTTNILYWTITGLIGAMMLFSGIANAIVAPGSTELIVDHLHYPDYFISYIAVAKVLGAIAILIPGWPRVKEWAYFGLFLDLFSAIYSMVKVGDPLWGQVNGQPGGWLPMVPFLLVLVASYLLYHKRLKMGSAT
jgi:uncharacterized membrane protein